MSYSLEAVRGYGATDHFNSSGRSKMLVERLQKGDRSSRLKKVNANPFRLPGRDSGQRRVSH